MLCGEDRGRNTWPWNRSLSLLENIPSLNELAQVQLEHSYNSSVHSCALSKTPCVVSFCTSVQSMEISTRWGEENASRGVQAHSCDSGSLPSLPVLVDPAAKGATCSLYGSLQSPTVGFSRSKTQARHQERKGGSCKSKQLPPISQFPKQLWQALNALLDEAVRLTQVGREHSNINTRCISTELTLILHNGAHSSPSCLKLVTTPSAPAIIDA